MFTGIIVASGRLAASEAVGGDRRLRIDVPADLGREITPGDSVAVNGVCLTAVDPRAEQFAADVSV